MPDSVLGTGNSEINKKDVPIKMSLSGTRSYLKESRKTFQGRVNQTLRATLRAWALKQTDTFA